ncbi:MULTISPECIES: helix-turn-helix domain-containing protein [unclassified Bradyrhizobium]|uniref:helix-turn-helix domain-containing protein n=1 Tax=unclassified Bradyrhizobium TaxID=2631580 RepID=UPI001141A2FD|nr:MULTISPECIES: helix-turn-helix transcriptional regulator [unclassified Bradyrhizobium]MBB4261310.1 transcriptional regulator with XRE-family HTH domain [Bradyrhizobium sp. CIR3A]
MKSKKSEPAQFDVAALHAALDAERIARRLNWKDVSAESGVSASTLTRLSQGKRPDVDSLAALTQWLGLPADRFMGQRKMAFGAASPLTQISSILREDPNLNQDAAAALDELIKATYTRLRSQK